MNEWLWAATGLIAGVLALALLAARRPVRDALVALELAGTLSTAALLLLAEGTRRQSFGDLALVLAVMQTIGSIAFIRLLRGRALMRDVAVAALLIAGGALSLLAVLGVALMRDAYERLHYLAPAAPATACFAAAVVVRDSLSLIGSKALLLAAFVLVTSPVLAHATARALRALDAEGRS